MSICPIGIEDCDRGCPNYYFECKPLTYAWEIPYYKDESGALVVKQYGWRIKEWTSYETCYGDPMNRCSLPSGQYLRRESNCEYEFKARLVEAWKGAGWMAAEAITQRSKVSSVVHPF